jgi:hypothetical protein
VKCFSRDPTSNKRAGLSPEGADFCIIILPSSTSLKFMPMELPESINSARASSSMMVGMSFPD